MNACEGGVSQIDLSARRALSTAQRMLSRLVLTVIENFHAGFWGKYERD